MALTDTKIRNAKPTERPFKLTDAAGLYLEVRPTGAKLWRYRYRIAGKENVYVLGEYPTVGLAAARLDRAAARELVKKGIHPAHERKSDVASQLAENANTFRAIAQRWMAAKKKNWSAGYTRQIERAFEADVYPQISTKPIKAVTAADILKIMKKVEGRGNAVMAMNIRQWCGAVFRYAGAHLLADADPTAVLRGTVTRPKVVHRKPLSRTEITLFYQALEEHGGYRTTVIALRLLLLTFVRTGELRAAEWSEFDFDTAEWRIPRSRMKMDEEHIVPLSRQSLDFLKELHQFSGGRRYLFPNYRSPNACMTATTLNRALERMGFNGKDSLGFSAHGFRATASTLLNELGYKSDVVERQLAHSERNKVRASYNQAQYLAERRQLMQEWADLMDGLLPIN